MTDPRFRKGLLSAIQRLPAGSGVVYRHYQLAGEERRKLFGQVRRICRRRGHTLLLAGTQQEAMHWQADGFHGRMAGKVGLHSAPVHDIREMQHTRRSGAQLLFLSPLYSTRSHPGKRAIGLHRFNQLAKLAKPTKIIALGGMTRNRARSLNAKTIHGWAAIDAFMK